MSDFYVHNNYLDSEGNKLAHEAIRSTEDTASRLEKLEVQYAKLSWLTESLWTILRDNLHLNEAVLKSTIHNVLKYHESVDRQTIDCPHCRQPNLAKKKTCIYCGTELSDQTSDSLL